MALNCPDWAMVEGPLNELNSPGSRRGAGARRGALCDRRRSQQIAQLSWRLRRLPSAHGAIPTCGFSPALNERRPDTSGQMKEYGGNEYGGLPVIHEITRGSVVDYFGTPAIRSMKGKHDPNLPIKHWWITAPVAEAVVVAEQLSSRHDRLFPPLHRQHAAVARSDQMLDAFTAHVNSTNGRTGLQKIPPGNIRPHMFRRTMAMLTDQFPGSEIAVGIQLKHIASRALANRSTQGYANADSSWAAHLDSAIEAARFRRLEDLYRTHKSGTPIGYGPGAAQMAQTFNDIQHKAQAHGGDATLERALLRQARISIRFGVLNHCVMDQNNPAGAACLENAIVPDGHKGPLHDRCRPDRCANSVIGAEHVPIWASEQRNLLTLIDTPRLSTCRKEALQRELSAVEAVLTSPTRTRSRSEQPRISLRRNVRRRGIAPRRQTSARCHGSATGRAPATHRRTTDQRKPVERSRRKPSHHEPSRPDTGRMESPHRRM